MKKQRVVITGGPGTGKTSLVTALENRGENCFHEISREVILKARKKGIEQLFLKDPLLFSEQLLDGRLRQFNNTAQFKDSNNTAVFFDRGLPDVVAYLNFKQEPYPKTFDTICKNYRYDTIFILPPWKKIYKQDNERYESFDEALKIYHALDATYRQYGYAPIEIPKMAIDERIDFIYSNII